MVLVLLFGTLLQLQFVQSQILEATYNAVVGEFIPYEIEVGGEWGNKLQSQDYCLGQWGAPRNRLRAGGFTYEGNTWTPENRSALRRDLQAELATLWGNEVDVAHPQTEYFSAIPNAAACAQLCLLLEVEQSDPFKDLSCGGFEYEELSNKCMPAQNWIRGRQYNTSCRLDTRPDETSAGDLYSYCCAPECCSIGDRTCDLDQYYPRAVKIELDLVPAVFIRKFPQTTAPTSSPTVAPTLSPTLSPSRTTTVPPTVEPTLSPTVRPSQPPSFGPTPSPTSKPTHAPTSIPTTSIPTQLTSITPTQTPTLSPSVSQTQTAAPSLSPSHSPTTPLDANGRTSADRDSTDSAVVAVVVVLIVIAIVVLIFVILRRRKMNHDETQANANLRPDGGGISTQKSIHIDLDSKDLNNGFYIGKASSTVLSPFYDTVERPQIGSSETNNTATSGSTYSDLAPNHHAYKPTPLSDQQTLQGSADDWRYSRLGQTQHESTASLEYATLTQPNTTTATSPTTPTRVSQGSTDALRYSTLTPTYGQTQRDSTISSSLEYSTLTQPNTTSTTSTTTTATPSPHEPISNVTTYYATFKGAEDLKPTFA